MSSLRKQGSTKGKATIDVNCIILWIDKEIGLKQPLSGRPGGGEILTMNWLRKFTTKICSHSLNPSVTFDELRALDKVRLMPKL